MPAWKASLAASLLLSSASAVTIPFGDNAGQEPLKAATVKLRSAFTNAIPSELAAAGLKDKPLVDSAALQSKISVERLTGHADNFYAIANKSAAEYGHPTRVIGSAGHNGTLDYIYSIISSLGGGQPASGVDGYYKVWKQSFPATSGSVHDSRLVLNNSVINATAMSLTPPTLNKKPVSGSLKLVANKGCNAADYPALNGSIALIQRGNCSFSSKSELAGKAGAIAAVVYNNEAGALSGTLGTPSPNHIATFGVSDTQGASLARALSSGTPIAGSAYIDSDVLTILTENVLAQTVDGDPQNCVMLGGHSDSVAEGPGINDDGSGSISLLEIATQLSQFNVSNCVRFAWWAAEEEGLLGSDYYAENLTPEENLKIRVFMDYDMLASPNFAYQVYNSVDSENPAGSEALRDLYIDYYNEQGLNHTMISFDGRSDYDGFIRAGIPAGGIATGAEGVKTEEEALQFGGKAGAWYDPCYHQLCDDTKNPNVTAWEVNTKLVAHSVATYAVSFEGFPNRTLKGVSARSASAHRQRVVSRSGKLFF